MKNILPTPGNRLKYLRNILELTQNGLAKRLGMEGYQVRDMESGKVEISFSLAKLLHHETGTNPEWILDGKEPMMLEEKHLFVGDESVRYQPGEFVFIPQVSGEISAGGGLVPDNTIEMRIAFRREWIERKGNPTNMSLIRVNGDSMEPTLMSGDLVLVDHNRNFIDPQGGIYAILMDAIIMIKRVQLIYTVNRAKIISDNARYEPLDVDPGQVKINGKVVWFGRELER